MILPELSGALEVAVIVKCLPNIRDAAEIIEQYAKTVASGALLDRRLEELEEATRARS